MKIVSGEFGQYQGEKVYSYKLENNQGMSITCITLGCIITEINTANQNGEFENVVLGFDDVDSYIEKSPYFGAVIGRVAGRIDKGEFDLNGETYTLPQNENTNHLHGGPEGFDRQLWQASTFEKEDEVGIEFSYRSKAGEAGYPGNLNVRVTYILNNQNEIVVHYFATTDKDTLVNLTNHTYFNLSGNVKQDILSHELTLKSQKVLELNESFIPTGKFLDVANTPFDFRDGKKINDAVSSNDPQIKLVGQGVDHPFLLDENHNEEICLSDEESGRKLIIETDEQSVVVYTSNMLDDSFTIRDVQSSKYLGICLETQGLPDSIHHPEFSPCILKAGDEYKTTTIYKFTTK
ncbi:aldose epimerase family protein [Metabacillus malikii]|uniref:Aldose 1-epimerase n=1 Tax=Metabacillus malikii TaxID=1504265 RepID=A0ABT9Z9K5_9BACI|nr:aldose epimerase family protein [Metabacillus malikii]MDQ0228939.1 aldose 1-epimerase [Metabacillus malikii]